jgi:hypothetical protein
MLDTCLQNIIRLLTGQVKNTNVSYYTRIFTGVNKKLDHYLNVCYNSQNQESSLHKLRMSFNLPRLTFVKTPWGKKEILNEEKFKDAHKYCG